MCVSGLLLLSCAAGPVQVELDGGEYLDPVDDKDVLDFMRDDSSLRSVLVSGGKNVLPAEGVGVQGGRCWLMGLLVCMHLGPTVPAGVHASWVLESV